MNISNENTYGAYTATRWVTVLFTLLLMLAAVMPGRAYAVPPPANAVISNEATASYRDGTGSLQEVKSNQVRSTVQQVFSHELTGDNVAQAAPGMTVSFPHTLTNTGNGADSFALSTYQLGDDGFNLESLKIYADANGDGEPDSDTPITLTGLVRAGEKFNFVVRGRVDDNQAHGATARIRVGAVGHASDPNNYQASSTPPVQPQKGNTDTVTVSVSTAVSMTKSYSMTSGPASNRLTVTLSYTNNSSDPVRELNIIDTIGGRGSLHGVNYDTRQMSYVANSTTIDGVPYEDNSSQVSFRNNTLSISPPLVAPGGSGVVRFDVQVNNATPGAEQTTNVAGFSWSGSAQFATNVAHYSVQIPGAISVALGDSRVPGAEGGAATSSRNNLNGRGAGTINDSSTITAPADSLGLDNGVVLQQVPLGGSPVFHTILTNTGVASENFSLRVDASSYPAGTRFAIVDDRGNPLGANNANGDSESGPLAPNTARDVFVRVTLPEGVTVPATGWVATVIATAMSNPGISDTTVIKVGGDLIPAHSVDLRNTTVNGPGEGFASGDDLAAATLSRTADPGETVAFRLWVSNNGTAIDKYDLQSFGAYTVNAGAADSSAPLPAGWRVEFKSTGNSVGRADCQPAGTVVSTTGDIEAGGACEFDAFVSVPSGYEAGRTALYFRAWSSAHGADAATAAGYDVIRNDVSVNTRVSISLMPERPPIQTIRRGKAYFAHQLCNTGNIDIAGAGTEISATHSDSAFTSELFVDANGNGRLDDNERAYVAATDGALAKPTISGPSCVNLVNVVTLPRDVSTGAINHTTLLATVRAENRVQTQAQAIDTVHVGVEALSLIKKQKIVNCQNGQGPEFVAYDIATPIPPGGCLRYRVVARNNSREVLRDVTIFEKTPEYSTLKRGPGCMVEQGGTPGILGGISNDGETGELSLRVPALAPTRAIRLEFCVKVNQ
jgi:hypothetical protein